MSPVLKSAFFINRVRVLCRQVRLRRKVRVSSPGFSRVRVLYGSESGSESESGFRSMPLKPEILVNDFEIYRWTARSLPSI